MATKAAPKGFDLYSGTLEVCFEDTRFEGAVVKLRSDVPLVDWLEFHKLSLVSEEMAWLVEHDVILSWNLERDGQPIPITAEEASNVPVAFGRALAKAWQEVCATPDIPFTTPSPSGNGPGRNGKSAASPAS